jgi:hypothetical protein
MRYDDVVTRGLTRDDEAEDVRGINGSLGLIDETRCGSWPTEAVSEEEIIVHENLHYRMGVRQPLTR